MLEFLILVVSALVVFYAVCWLMAWTLVFVAYRYGNLDVSIGSVGFMAFTNIKITTRGHATTVSVEIEKVWLSSSCVNRNTKKLVGVCVTGCRVLVDLPSPSRQSTRTRYSTKSQRFMWLFTTLSKWLHLYVEALCVIVKGGPFEDCIIHTTVEETFPEVIVNDNFQNVFFIIKQCQSKILCSEVLVQQSTSPYLGQCDFSCSIHAEMTNQACGSLRLKEARFELLEPKINIHQDLISHVARWKLHDKSKETALEKQTPGPSLNLPEKISFNITGTSIVLTDIAQNELCGTIELVQSKFAFAGNETVTYVNTELELKNLALRSTTVNMCSVHALHLSVKAGDTVVEVSSQVLSCFAGYHLDEATHWIECLSTQRGTLSQGYFSGIKPKGIPLSTSLQHFLGNRSLRMNGHVKNLSAAVASKNCPGLKLGLAEARMSWSQSTCGRVITSERNFDMEMSSFYLKLTDGGVSSVVLSQKLHHLNTIMYIGLIVAKCYQLRNSSLCVDLIVDSAQMELSSKGIRTLNCLVGHGGFQKAEMRRSLSDGSTGTSASTNTLSVAELNSQFTNLNVFLSYEHEVCTCLRVDQIMTLHDTDMQFNVQGVKMEYISPVDKILPLNRSVDVQHSVFSAKQYVVSVSKTNRSVSLNSCEGFLLEWTTALHLCVFQIFKDVHDLCLRLQNFKVDRRVTPKPTISWTVVVSLTGNNEIVLNMQKNHTIRFASTDITLQRSYDRSKFSLDRLIIDFDDHPIFNVENIEVSSDYTGDKLFMERKVKHLDLSSNRAWAISFGDFSVTFPFKYNFAACFDEVKLLNKWRKHVHKVQRSSGRLPPDIVIKVRHVQIQINDDPFEVKLGDNYKLACDEYLEHEKRIHALDIRVQDLRKKHGLLPASKVEELYGALEASRAGHYIRRSIGLYSSSPPRETLWRWTMDNLEITSLADPSIHGTQNVFKTMKEINSESPLPNDMEFVTSWCRHVNVSTASFMVGLRDYPLPMLNIQDLHVWGRLVGAEQKGSMKARRKCTIQQGHPWGQLTVERNMPPLKFYHDLSCDVSNFDIAYGGCWEPAQAQFNLLMNQINKPSVDPSRPLPFWDKSRLLLHGRLTILAQKMRWLYHASLDPYNKTEMMDWTWSDLILDWSNAKWILKGDLDIYAKTASKYDDCRLLHLPNLKLSVDLHWITVGNPNDHHSVEPCSPEHENLIQDKDSYANFRSQYYNTQISIETKRKKLDKPGCLFFASTLRWMDKIKMCMARVSRPISRGKVFGHIVQKKPPLTRHIRDVTFSIQIHEFEVDFWASFARQSGFRTEGSSLGILVGLQLEISKLEDGLHHRPQSSWSVVDFDGSLNDVSVWVCTLSPDKRHSKQIVMLGPVTRSFLLSVEKVSYHRVDTKKDNLNVSHGSDMESDLANHRVQVRNLKGAWTPSNRDVALALYDAYMRSKRVKKNLSSEALQCYKLDSSKSLNKQNRSLNMSGTKALSKLASSNSAAYQNDPAFSMLQKLVSESDTKFVAANEEMPEPELLVKQLHGVAVCDTEDVTKKNWHVELYNSQVMLRGVETTGYVIVSAAKASLLACDHKPIWQAQQLKSKSSLIGSVESMQYYATIENLDNDEDIIWLSKHNIIDQEPGLSDMSGLEGMIGLADMVSSGQSVGGVVTDIGICGSQGQAPPQIQLQRIISRCHCEFFYVGYGEVDDKTLTEVAVAQENSGSDMMKKEEGVDCVTLLHHDLNVCTNSLQYDMLLDIVNNLLLYVQPKKRELTEKLQNMRFSLELASVEDQKTPILQRQNTLRELLLRTRWLEKELYNLHRSPEDKITIDAYVSKNVELQNMLEECKEQISSLNEELTIMVSCFKESQIQTRSHHKSTPVQKDSPISRLYEVCFKHAEWRMTEDDGQIGIADLVLKNFMYKKTNSEDESGSHLLELGWVKVTNLLPGAAHKDVLIPRDPLGKLLPERLHTLRILCKFKSPVGGISVKEHFEVNITPLSIQLTSRFYRTVMAYFFRENKQSELEVSAPGVEDFPGNQPTAPVTIRGKRREDRQEAHTLNSRHSSMLSLADDVDKMRQRAAKNSMFVYIKVPEVPLRVSYKGDKEKNITNINDFQFLLPTLEYHEKTWTWHDLAVALKNDSKKKLIGQAVQQKLNIKMHLLDFMQEEVHEDDDKARLVLGTKLLPGIGGDKKGKKNVFGGKHKS